VIRERQCGDLYKETVDNCRCFTVTGTTAWPLDQGKLCKRFWDWAREPSASVAEVAALSPEQKEKYLEAGTPGSHLRRRDPEETKA